MDKDLVEKIAQKVNGAFKEMYPDGRDPDRIPVVVESLKNTWKKVPDWRLGQLISNIVGDSDLFNIEDDELLNKVADLFHKVR